MKIKTKKLIGIAGTFPKIGDVVDVAPSLARELIWRDAAVAVSEAEPKPVTPVKPSK